MAITTLDGVIAGLRPPEDVFYGTVTPKAGGLWHSLLYTAGRPGAGSAPTPGINGAALTSYTGQIPFTNPSAGLNSYLARLEMAGTVAGKVLLYDRLWHNSGLVVTTTTAQSITPVAIPARDRDGTTDGEGVTAWIEVSTATTNAGQIGNCTCSYTNSAGTAGRTGTLQTFPATAVAGSIVPFNLQAGDTGVRSVQSVTLGTSMVTGKIHLVLMRPLSSVSWIANMGAALDVVQLGMIRLYDNTVPMMAWLPSQVTAINLFGQMVVAQG